MIFCYVPCLGSHLVDDFWVLSLLRNLQLEITLVYFMFVCIFFNILFHITLTNYSFCSDAEKSKHLETATMRLFGISIDFVNLRTEKYKDDSNIPEVYICPVSFY